MRPPLWILNSALLVLVLFALLFVVFSRQSMPEWEDVSPSTYGRTVHKKPAEINIKKIYEHDLFDTYEKEAFVEAEHNVITAFPEPPVPRRVQVPVEPKPEFLEPLPVVLKGIIFIHNDDAKNRIIISDTKTKKENLFKVGDAIEDAQLIKIFNQKAIFLRSNGQQEVLYLRAKDAQLDPAYVIIGDWKEVVQRINDTVYKVSPREFTKRIKSLAQFIDMFELTTVYQQGKSVGCRIGSIESDSFARELGFMRGDIITSIDDIPVTDAQNRFKLYKQIVSLPAHASLEVHLLRNKQETTLTFVLDDFKVQKPQSEQTVQEQRSTPMPTQEQLESLEKRHTFAPTLQDIRERERVNMSKLNRRTLTSKFTG